MTKTVTPYYSDHTLIQLEWVIENLQESVKKRRVLKSIKNPNTEAVVETLLDLDWPSKPFNEVECKFGCSRPVWQTRSALKEIRAQFKSVEASDGLIQ